MIVYGVIVCGLGCLVAKIHLCDILFTYANNKSLSVVTFSLILLNFI